MDKKRVIGIFRQPPQKTVSDNSLYNDQPLIFGVSFWARLGVVRKLVLP